MSESVQVLPIHPASCHCGAVKFEVALPRGLADVRHCNCSICRRHGAIMVTVALDGLRILEGRDALSLYQFNTMTAKHYFCSTCGVYTHHQRRSNPDEYGVNVGCLEGVDPFRLGIVNVSDGVHHSSDRAE